MSLEVILDPAFEAANFRLGKAIVVFTLQFRSIGGIGFDHLALAFAWHPFAVLRQGGESAQPYRSDE